MAKMNELATKPAIIGKVTKKDPTDPVEIIVD